MLYHFLLYTLAIVFVAGCSNSTSILLKKDKGYAQNIQYTKISKVIYKDKVVLLLNATYLNSVDTKIWNKDQNFLVSAYKMDNDALDFNVTLNEKKPYHTRNIDKTDKIYKNIAFRNGWAKYKLLTFKDDENTTLVLKVSNSVLGSTIINFIKE